jgi:hypothetical protein
MSERRSVATSSHSVFQCVPVLNPLTFQTRKFSAPIGKRSMTYIGMTRRLLATPPLRLLLEPPTCQDPPPLPPLNGFRISCTCLSERPSLNICIYLSKPEDCSCPLLEILSFFIGTFWATIATGVRCMAFLANWLLCRGIEGSAGVLWRCFGRGVATAEEGIGLVMARSKEMGPVRMKPSCICDGSAPLEVLT